MPVCHLEDARGMVESGGKVRCADCVKDWATDFDREKEELITEDDVERGERLYVCDYCGDKL